jgi:hypothetical protein
VKQEPLIPWEHDISPYDALAPGGITPHSRQREIQDASYTLIEHGLWTPEKRAAWDELRRVEGRLWVDFFLLPTIADAREELQLEPLADFGELSDAAMRQLTFDT